MKITRRAGLKGLMAGAAAVAMPSIGRSQQGDIVIGAPNSLTGGLGELGTRAAWGLQLATDQINRDGGIKSLGGAKLKLVIADTTSENPTQAASLTRRMIDQEGAVVIAGATASAMTLAAQVEAEKSQVPLITNSYADGIVTRGYKYTFKLTPQGGAIWNWSMSSAYEMWKASKGSPPKTAAIFMSNDAVGLVVQKQLPEHAKTLNLEVPFSTGLPDGALRPVGRGGAGAALQARHALPRRLHQRPHPDRQGAARGRRQPCRSSVPVPPAPTRSAKASAPPPTASLRR